MTPQKESPWTVCRPAKGKKQREIKQHFIALIAGGQSFFLAWMPCIEMLLPALVVAFMGAIR